MKRSLLLAGLLLAPLADAATTAPAAIASIAQAAATDQACADVAPDETGPTDLDLLNQRIVAAQSANAGTGFEEACRGWRLVRREHPADATLQVDWQAKVAAGRVYQGRSAEAEPLLDAAYRHYEAAGPTQDGKRSMVAGMLTVVSIQRAQLDTALQWSQRAVDASATATSGVSANDRLHLRLNHGAMLSRARRYDEAEALLKALLAESLARPDQATEAAMALNALANLARRQSRFEAALDYTEHEIALRQASVTQDPVNIASAMHNRGLLLMNLARYDEAETALQAALRNARQAQAAGAVDLWGHQASVRETLSGLLLARGRPADALQVADEAVAALAGRPEAGSARGARPLRRVAEAQLALGELGLGVESYRRALALLATTVGAPEADTAQALRLGYALTMVELGELDEAEATLKTILADTRPRSADEQARTQVLQATLALRRGDTAAAATAWQAADRALAAALPPGHPNRRFIQAQLCELQVAPCTGSAGDAGETAASTPDLDALTLISQARRQRAEGAARAADGSARQAVAAAMASGQPRLQWQALALWADIQADAGQRSQAIFLGKLALDRLQQQRQRLLPLGTVADARYLADKAPLYRKVADWLLQAQRVPEALEVMRLLKVQEQADYNERGLGDAGATGGLSLNAAEQAALQHFESALQGGSGRTAELRTLAERAAAQRITPEEAARLAQLRRDEAQLRDGRLAGLDTLLAGLRGPAPRARAPAPRQRPPAGQLHVYTLAGEQRLSLLLVGTAGTQLHQIELPAAELARQVALLRDALATHSDGQAQVQARSEALYARIGRLIDEAARRQHAGRIVAWLDGPLRYLPPGLMSDGRRHLAERYRWTVAGGLSATPQDAAPRPSATLQVAAFGVTQSLQGLPALPAVADELCDIVDGPVSGLEEGSNHCGTAGRGRGPLRGQGLLNARFTEAALTRAGAAAAPGDLLHIGTHFVLRPGSVSKSWLLLGDGARLPLERMRSLDIGRPRLVTLSACETAVVDALGDGREVDGLAAALLDNGAGQVLASLWRVDDRATARFMQRFYAAYAKQRGDAAAALQQAQRQAIAEGAPARDWAAFVLLAQAGGAARAAR